MTGEELKAKLDRLAQLEIRIAKSNAEAADIVRSIRAPGGASQQKR